MNKMNLKWIVISLILIAPYIELVRLIIDNYHLFRDFELPNIFSSGHTRKLTVTDLHAVLFALKYFFLLYGVGLGVGLRYRIIECESKNIIYSMAYIYVFIAILAIVCALLVEGMGYLFQLHPFMVISSFLIILSLAATRRSIVHSAKNKGKK